MNAAMNSKVLSFTVMLFCVFYLARGQRRCTSRQFACVDRRQCIPAKRFCDGVAQCRDKSDEVVARPGVRGIRCRRNSRLCILPNILKSRQQLLCAKNVKCSKDQFKCSDNSKCIRATQFCDGKKHCPDGSDEVKSIRNLLTAKGISCQRKSRVCLLPRNQAGKSDFLCQKSIKCESDEFACLDKTKCIPANQFCDGTNHCPDASDEVPIGQDPSEVEGLSCRRKSRVCVLPANQAKLGDSLCEESIKCQPDEFACSDNSKCIPWHWYCDGMADCGDQSDEVQLPSSLPGIECHRHRYSCLLPETYSTNIFCKQAVVCGPEEFPCADGTRCIPWSRFCSGYPECRDHSDEHGIYSKKPGILCRRGNNVCMLPEVFESKYETMCSRNAECREDEFICLDGTQCIRWSGFCDGLPGCRDESDEINLNSTVAGIPCRHRNHLCILPEIYAPRKDDFCEEDAVCGSDEFACADGTQCISASQFCDGSFDCKDYSDERMPSEHPLGIPCRRGKRVCILPENSASKMEEQCLDENCGKDDFVCSDESQCIPSDWFCDGVAQCRDGSDELPSNERLKSSAERGIPCHRNGRTCLLPRKQASKRNIFCKSDEKSVECSDDEFMCRDGSKCVRAQWFCDGESYCGDNSDAVRSELNPIIGGIPCRYNEFICLLPEDQGHKRDSICRKNADCEENEFACLDGSQCLQKELFCDGYPDCNDASDEISPLSEMPGITCLGSRNSWIYFQDYSERGGNVCVLPENQAMKKKVLCGNGPFS